MNMKFRIFAAVFLTLALFVGCAIGEEPSRKQLKVGAILGLTGSAARHSDGIRKGIEMAAADLQAKGWNIEIKFEDDQTNPAKTASALQFLLAQGFRLFIGPTWSFQVNAVRPILAKNQVVAMVPAGSSEINGGPGDGVFNLCPARTQQLPLLTSWLKDRNLKRGFALTPNGDWGEIHRHVFTEAIRASGGTVVGDAQFDYGIDAPALGSLLLKAKQSQADVVFVTGSASDVANALRARNAARLGFVLIGSEDMRDARNLGLAAPEEFEHEVYSSGLSVAVAFRERFKSLHTEEPILYSDRGYDALMLLAAAAESGAADATAVKEFLKHVDYPGLSGRIQFNTQGDVVQGVYQITKVGADKP